MRIPDGRIGGGVGQVIEAVSAETGVSSREILGRRKKRRVVVARHLAMYVVREALALPYEDVGLAFGGRDHTTVMHGVRKVARFVEAGDAGVISVLERIRSRIGVPAMDENMAGSVAVIGGGA